MNNFIYKVVYQPQGREALKTKEYNEIKDIQEDFKITKEQIKNFFLSVSAVKHESIRRIDRCVVPLKKPQKIVITFD